MKDILETIVSRRSIKKFKPKMVKQEQIEKVIKAGTFAPSGKNRQAAIILAVTNKQVRDSLSFLCSNVRGLKDVDPFYGAPVVLAVLADKNVPTYIYDGSVVLENMLLEAHSINLGACWIHHAKEVFETEEGKEILKKCNIEGNYEGIGFCILGYPDMQIKNELPRKDNFVYYLK